MLFYPGLLLLIQVWPSPPPHRPPSSSKHYPWSTSFKLQTNSKTNKFSQRVCLVLLACFIATSFRETRNNSLHQINDRVFIECDGDIIFRPTKATTKASLDHSSVSLPTGSSLTPISSRETLAFYSFPRRFVCKGLKFGQLLVYCS